MTLGSPKPRVAAAGLEAAVAVAARLASTLFNAATIVVLAASATPAEQGYYFTFLSLISFAALADAGLTTVLVQFIAHERAGLVVRLDKVEGPVQLVGKVRQLVQISMRWYLALAGMLAVGLLLGGYGFLSQRPDDHVAWRMAWGLTALAAALDIVTLPLLATLMGLGFVRSASFFRLAKVFGNAVVLWGGLSLGLGLNAIGPGILAGSLTVFALCALRFAPLFLSLLKGRETQRIRWREDILPMQWRVAVSWLAGYMIFAVMTPIAFQVRGPALAGQVGASFGLVQAVMMLGYAVVESQLPRMGALVAKGGRSDLDTVTLKTGAFAVGLSLAASVAGLALLYLLRRFGVHFVDRLLPLCDVSILLVGAVVQSAITVIGSYLRAHRRDPLMELSVLTGVIMTPTIAGACFVAGGHGIAIAFSSVSTLIALPLAVLVLRRFRKNVYFAAVDSSPQK